MDYVLKDGSGAKSKRHIDYRAELNQEQYEAVAAPAGPLLVIAGAGSGKTRTLTYRVAWLLEQGLLPEELLLITFTNKAAKEMLERVGNLIPHDLSRLWGGTFHHVGNRILRRHIDQFGFDRGFTILDRDDSASLVKQCMDEVRFNKDKKDKRAPKADLILDVLSYRTNTALTVREAVEKKYGQLEDYIEPMEMVADVYTRRKREANAVDFDDLLAMPLALFQQNESLLKRYQKQFQQILVDEYQDTNKLQSSWVDLIGAEHHNIMAVGDDAQSIYSWRGADFSNIMTFPDRHPGTRILHLETNYRSIPAILSLANETISQNVNQYPKNLRATRKGGVKPALVALEDSRQQASFIVQRVGELIEEGIEPNEIAILYRSHFHSMELQMELTRRMVPFTITSGIRFFEQAHVKDVAAYLRLLINPRDELAFRRIILMLPGVGERTAGKLWQDFLSGTPATDLRIPEKARALWLQWCETERQLREKDVQFQPAELIQTIVQAVVEDYLKLTYANFESRLEDLQQLQSFAESFTETGEFLSQLALLTNMEVEDGAAQKGAPSIRLSTIHQAKGLEFQAVFVIMLCEGLFPTSRSLEDPTLEEEERRLFYVAVTRAKDELYMTYPRLRAFQGQGDVYQSPSRFVEELTRELCNIWRVRAPDPYEDQPVRKPRNKNPNTDEHWQDDPF